MQHIYGLVRRCVDDYGMISDGDRVAVGVSGGKDSLTLLRALAGLRAFIPQEFTPIAVTIDPGWEGMDFSGVRALCGSLGVEYHVFPGNIKQVVFDIRKEQNPCSLCAKLRRGALNNAAKSLGCNKVALAHHQDDAIETFMLSMLYEGRISCFEPVTYLDRKDVTLIRPMLYVREKEIKRAAKRLELPVVRNLCPADKHTKRQEVKNLIAELDYRYRGFDNRLFGAIQRYPLRGWEKPGEGKTVRPGD